MDSSNPQLPPAVGSIGNTVQPSIAIEPVDEFHRVESGHRKESNDVAFSEAREIRRVGELNAALSHRVTRHIVDQWTSHKSYEEGELLRSREVFDLPGAKLADERHKQEDNAGQSAVMFSMGTVATTVLGTGVVLWVVQATQIAATLITAAAPTWIHVDIASALDNLAKEKNAKDEASAKIFE